MLIWGLIIAVIAILLIILFSTLGNGLLKGSVSANGEDSEEATSIDALNLIGANAKDKPSYVAKNEAFLSLDRGFNINLLGAPQMPKEGVDVVYGGVYAVNMADFVGMAAMPKVIPAIGDHVKAGEPLFFDKTQPEIIYAAPVSGILKDVVRGEKRAIRSILIEADATIQYHAHDVIPSLDSADQATVRKFFLDNGLWALMRQRPYDVVASPNFIAKSIFVSTFDTAPLAPNLDYAVKGNEAAFEQGLKALTKLIDGPVHLGLSANGEEATAYSQFKVEGVTRHWVKGQHPAGNVGVHIHHIDPINTDEAVWYLDVHAVITIGKLFLTGVFDSKKLIALSGAELEQPTYVYAHQGVSLETLNLSVKGDMANVRLISGDALSGKKVDTTGFLGFFDDQITAVKEGNYYEMFGWLIPQKGHPTRSGTFPGAFAPSAEYVADTNTNGEKRAFVMSGEYEAVLPMDIYPQFLCRAIMANDLEKMVGLGILEMSEEDIAICEYVCTSKQPLQTILRGGLDFVREQLQ